MNHYDIYRKHIKRILDVILSALALVVMSPLIAAVALIIRIKLGSPIIFKQARPGMNEKLFYIYKFRSMTNKTGEDGRLLPDTQRLTKFGRILRASSLDEIPELLNILCGDMSIVGPRPLSIYYLPHYPNELRRRHEVRPGLTGLAQVNGRNNLPWEDRFKMDIKYVDNLSFTQDVKIVLDTILKVLKHSGVSVRGTTKVQDYGPYCVLKEEKNGGRQVTGMTYSEIGSYFWLDEKESSKKQTHEIHWLPDAEDSSFTFSGRNAIDMAIADILHNHKIKRALVPGYCCISMLQPFLDHNVKIEYYDVGYHDGVFTYQVPDVDEQTAVLIMSYFGLEVTNAHKVISKLHEKGAVIIEDITHSLLRSDPASSDSDYLVASLRKWIAVPTGGWIGKKEGSLIKKPDIDSDHAVTEKIAAMHEKYAYLTGETDSKESFLLANAKFENDLIHVDKMLKLDSASLGFLQKTDMESVIAKRRKNAGVLLDGLQALKGKGLQIPNIDLTKDTPLFLPVLLKTEDRDALRKALIEKGIYCPVHWPEIMGAEPGLRQYELSLICDQRYSEGDMQVIIEAIKAWFTENK